MSDSPASRHEARLQTERVKRIATGDGLSSWDAYDLAKRGSRRLGEIGLVDFSPGGSNVLPNNDSLDARNLDDPQLTGFEAASQDYTGADPVYD